MSSRAESQTAPLSAEGLRWLQVLTEVAVVVAVYLVYSLVRALSTGAADTAVANAEDLVRWQRDWGLDWEPSLQAWAMAHRAVIQLANVIYFWLHLPVLIVFAVWMFFANREAFRFLRNVWVITQIVGVIIYYLYPVAPPRLLPDAYGFADTMALYSPINYTTDEAGPLMNQYAALPSLHFAWAFLIAAGLYVTIPWRRLRLLSLLFPAASFWSIVATGNHYVADALGGLAVVSLAFLAACALDRLRPLARSRQPALKTTDG